MGLIGYGKQTIIEECPYKHFSVTASTVLLQLKIYIDISKRISYFASPNHFSEGLYSRDLSQIGILGGNWHFGWG